MAMRLSCRSYFLSSRSVDTYVPQQLEVKKSVAEAAVASSFAGKAVCVTWLSCRHKQILPDLLDTAEL